MCLARQASRELHALRNIGERCFAFVATASLHGVAAPRLLRCLSVEAKPQALRLVARPRIADWERGEAAEARETIRRRPEGRRQSGRCSRRAAEPGPCFSQLHHRRSRCRAGQGLPRVAGSLALSVHAIVTDTRAPQLIARHGPEGRNLPPPLLRLAAGRRKWVNVRKPGTDPLAPPSGEAEREGSPASSVSSLEIEWDEWDADSCGEDETPLQKLARVEMAEKMRPEMERRRKARAEAARIERIMKEIEEMSDMDD